jgi:hypothetical protein
MLLFILFMIKLRNPPVDRAILLLHTMYYILNSRLDDMPTARYGLSCGALTNEDGVVTDIIVAGGYNSTYLDTVEIYSVTQMAWKSGSAQFKYFH